MILQTAKKRYKVEAVAMSSGQTQKVPRMVPGTMMVYVVEDLDGLQWLPCGWKSLASASLRQHVLPDHRRLTIMLFEDGNRIDLTLCPKEYIKG